MPYTRNCPACGRTFTAARVNRRWCSDRCRMAGKRAVAAGRPLTSTSSKSGLEESTPPGPVALTVAAALTRMRAEEAALAPLAVSLANRLDHDTEAPATGVAALSRELRATMADIAKEQVPGRDDPLTRLRAQREARRGE